MAFKRYSETADFNGDDAFALVSIAAKYVRLPSKQVVSVLGENNALRVFLTRRKRRADGSSVRCVKDPRILLDSNASAAHALMWPHGFTNKISGWELAHVWPTSSFPEAFANIANLCIISEPLGKLCDKNGPLVHYLKYHSYDTYGWSPDGLEVIKPDRYEEIDWLYFDDVESPIKQLDDILDSRTGKLFLNIREGNHANWRLQ